MPRCLTNNRTFVEMYLLPTTAFRINNRGVHSNILNNLRTVKHLICKFVFHCVDAMTSSSFVLVSDGNFDIKNY